MRKEEHHTTKKARILREREKAAGELQ